MVEEARFETSFGRTTVLFSSGFQPTTSTLSWRVRSRRPRSRAGRRLPRLGRRGRCWWTPWSESTSRGRTWSCTWADCWRDRRPRPPGDAWGFWATPTPPSSRPPLPGWNGATGSTTKTDATKDPGSIHSNCSKSDGLASHTWCATTWGRFPTQGYVSVFLHPGFILCVWGKNQLQKISV